MTAISSIVGNIKRDPGLYRRYHVRSEKGEVEFIRISRLESERTRMRKVSDKGTDVIVTLDQGSRLTDDDVLLLTDSKMILVKIEPENVATIEIKDTIQNDEAIRLAVKIGHTIGNLHRPIMVQGKKIFFPIQADSEIEMISRLLHRLMDRIEIKKVTMVLQPDSEMQTHEH